MHELILNPVNYPKNAQNRIPFRRCRTCYIPAMGIGDIHGNR